MIWKRNLGISFVLASVVFILAGVSAMLIGLFASASDNALSGILTKSMVLLPLSAIFALVFLPLGTVWMYKNTSSFSMGEIFRTAHRLLVSRFLFWFGLLLLPFVLSLGLSGIASFLKATPFAYGLVQVVGFVLSIALSFILTRLTILAARGNMVKFEDGWNGSGSLVKFFFGSFLVGVIIVLGISLFIIPGIYWGIRYGYVPFLIAEKGMSIGDAFHESSRLTAGVKLDVFAFSLVGNVFTFLAMIPLYLGFIYVLPLITLAQAVVYVKLSQRTV